jgi:hypothetical protein
MGAVEPKAVNPVLMRVAAARCETFAGKPIAIDGTSIRGTLEASNGAESAAAIHLVHRMGLESMLFLPQLAVSLLKRAPEALSDRPVASMRQTSRVVTLLLLLDPNAMYGNRGRCRPRRQRR